MECLLCEMLPAISLVLDYQEKGNLYHAWRVAIISYHLAGEAIPDSRNLIFYTALLHDIGIFGLGEHIINYRDLSLQKSTPRIRNHPVVGANIVKEIPGMAAGAPFILDHHERYDGLGYTKGKKKDEISLQAQIIRLSDSIDLFMRRKPKPGIEAIRRYCQEEREREFSKELYDLSLNLLAVEEGRLLLNIDENEKVSPVFNEMAKSIPAPEAEVDEDSLELILKVFAKIIDGKHHYTHQHSERVALYAQDMAKEMGLDEDEVKKIRFAGYLHDLGKIAIPDSILDKPGPLTKDEWELMKRHASISYEIVNAVESLKEIAPLVAASQERWDGKGYPRGLKGEESPLGARIIAVADAIDTMLSERSYRKVMPISKAVAELKINSGTQFDPEVVATALKLIDSGKTIGKWDVSPFFKKT